MAKFEWSRYALKSIDPAIVKQEIIQFSYCRFSSEDFGI